MLILLFLFLSLGCSAIRGNIQSIVAEDVKNYEASVQIAKDLLKTWRLNSGFIRGSLGDKLNQFPAEAIKAMNDLDRLAAKKEIDDFDLGYSLGARVRLMGAIIQNTLKQYAPEVLKYIPMVF
jgi:hypothetical protein